MLDGSPDMKKRRMSNPRVRMGAQEKGHLQ